MPATRSRTENWRQTLRAIYEKGGALEISLPRYIDQQHADQGAITDHSDLIWRVRILGMNDHEIVIEEPAALGHPIPLQTGIELIGLLAVGQNRWMFRTNNLGATRISTAGGRPATGYRLQMPTNVERCQRRSFYRVSTVGLHLPRVEFYALQDAGSATLAETASRCHILDLQEAHIAQCPREPLEPVMPEVGPAFHGNLVNIGGGGVGLLFEHNEQPLLDSAQLYWMRIRLEPHIPAPLDVSARLRHTHVDSSQRLYAGMAFEFGHSPGHEQFIITQLTSYVAKLQQDQLKKQTDPD